MHEIHFLPVVVVLLAAAVFIVAVFKRLNLSPVLGYLVAGAAIGPSGFAFIRDVGETSTLAEFGVVFLLFVIGLELSLDRLKAMSLHVFGFGSLQVLISGTIIGLVAWKLVGQIPAAIIIGGALALSSTAIVLQVMREQGEQSSQVGRLALAVLILQDLAVVPLLVLVPLLAGTSSSLAVTLMDAGLKALGAMVAIFVLGRLLLRPLFRMIASTRSHELFAATTLLIVLGASWATEQAGLSLALGAFMAGLIVAETEFSHQVEADILPYKGLLLGLFFMTVGMSIDFPFVMENFVPMLGLAIAIMSMKAAVVIALCRIFHFRLGAAIHSGLLLAQGGEFAFVLFNLAMGYELLEPTLAQFLMMTVTFSMALTPPAAKAGKKLGQYLEAQTRVTTDHVTEETLDLGQHVVVAGYGRMGQTICKLLSAEKLNYIAIDTDAKLVTQGRTRGYPVYYGDTTRPEVLESLGITRATTIIITVGDRYTARKTVRMVRDLCPDITIIVRAYSLDYIHDLEQAGADIVVPENFEASLQLGSALLHALSVPEHEITRIIQQFRTQGYAMSRYQAGGDMTGHP